MFPSIFSNFNGVELLSYFIIYSFLGWCTEVAYAWWRQRKFVNRGFLEGPYCPIYGFGVTFVIVLLYPLKEYPILLFLGAVVITSALELITGYLLEAIFNARWWDYSDEAYHWKGYICLKFSLIWGVASTFIVAGVHPLIRRCVRAVPPTRLEGILILIYLIFGIDLILTVTSMVKLNQLLKDLTEKLELFDRSRIKDKIRSGGQDILNTVEEKKEIIQELVSDVKVAVTQEIKREYDEILKRFTQSQKRIIMAFPQLKFHRFKEAFKRLKEEVNKKEE